MSVSFSGELAYELHVPNASLLLVHELIMSAGADEGISYFGLRAVESMRLEKGYLHWKADIITEFNPFETGLDRFVKTDKDFIGKDALIKMQSEGHRRNLVCLEIDSKTAPAHPGDSIVRDGEVVGTVTSCGWGHRVGKNIAYAFLDPAADTNLSVFMLGEEVPASICEMGLYDIENNNVR
jgi:dimethylglycine dehydrogenase